MRSRSPQSARGQRTVVGRLCVVAAAATALTLAVVTPPASAAAVGPGTPGAITISSVTSSSVALKWGGSSPGSLKVEGYRVLRCSGNPGCTPTTVVTTTDAVTSYTATNLRSGTSYVFGVVALNTDDDLSPLRSSAPVTTAASTDTTAPAAPSSSSVSLSAFSSSRIDVVWAASSSSDVSFYEVFRDGVGVGTVERPNGQRFSDNGLAAGSRHAYAVQAVDSAGNRSPLTTAKSATTLAPGTVQIKRGPYLEQVTGTTATVAWWTNVPSTGVVSYGAGSPTLQAKDAATVQQHVVRLSGLRPGTAYAYTVGNGAGVASTQATFRTAAAAGTSFSFAALGDFGGGSTGESQNATRIATDSTQFIQTLGDNIYPSAGNPDPDFSTVYSDFDTRFYKPFGVAVRTKPFFPANGNQEYYGDGAFWKNFAMPGATPGQNAKWYGYDWGDAHITVLDTEQPFAAGSAQYTFAQHDLSTHQKAKWRIVALQRPPYSSTSANSSSKPVQSSLVPLFQKYGVRLVLSGNSHNYERTYPLTDGTKAATGGTTYIVSGGGGNGFNQFTISPPAYSAFREAGTYEYVRVTVAPTSLTTEAISAADGSVLDRATILPSPSP
jgi:hypothetical protein